MEEHSRTRYGERETLNESEQNLELPQRGQKEKKFREGGRGGGRRPPGY